MALDVVGAGFGRTGTLSLKSALETLGFDRCYHMMEVREHPEHQAMWAAAQRGEPVDWDLLFDGYGAAVDWPACNLWRELAEYYPDAKVLLSVRDSGRWYDSVRNTIYASSMNALKSEDEVDRRRGEWLQEIIWGGIFDGRLEDRDYAIGVYEAHVKAVQASIPADRLLVFEASEGWSPLCEFLGVEIPETPFPHVNTTEDFRARFKA